MANDTLTTGAEIEDVVIGSSDEEAKEEESSPSQSKWYSYIDNSITTPSSRLVGENTSYSNSTKNTRIRSSNRTQPEDGGAEETSSDSIQVIDLTSTPKKRKTIDWVAEALGLVDAPAQTDKHTDTSQSDVEVENRIPDAQVSLVTEGTASDEMHSSSKTCPKTNDVLSPTSQASEKTESPDDSPGTIPLSNTDSSSKLVPTRESGSARVPSGKYIITTPKLEAVPAQVLAFNVYPSLCVRVRPSLRPKRNDDISVLRSQRLILDKMVRDLIQKSPAQLIEWCIIQGLLHPTQNCDVCHSDDGSPVAMNLMQYLNSSGCLQTGGYTWVCSLCKSFQKSVFTGSIFEKFEKSSCSLVTKLKLIYHWVNVTVATSILNWVKVEPVYVKHFFSLLRAVCTYAIHEHQGKLGGKSKIVQVGVVSMKPVESNNKKPLTFLGALDENNFLRLQLVESLKNGEKCGSDRMVRILSPLTDWIDENSIICTDYSINRRYLEVLGFSEVHQVATCASEVPLSVKYSNVQLKNYLKFQIPSLFKDSIFKLPRVVIQQFLNELTWRERWEQSPLETFTKILDHIAALTKDCRGAGMANRLFKMNEDPFRDWSKGALEKNKEVILLS